MTLCAATPANALLLSGLLLGACSGDDPPGAPGQCQVSLVRQVPLEPRNHLVLAQVEINDTNVPMILDTGAERSAISDSLVARLGLLGDPRNGSLLSGVGGQGVPVSDAIVSRFVFAGYDPGGGHYPVMATPFAKTGGALVGGLLGGDVLSHFDLDLDIAHNRLVLYEVRHCAGNFLPWTKPYTALPISVNWRGGVTLPVAVDGHTFEALLDTGSTTTLLDLAAAEAAGVTKEALAREPAGDGSGAAGVNFREVAHRFHSLAVGSDTLTNPILAVLDRTLNTGDMLLGIDYLRLRHIWLSYHTHQLFVEKPASP